MCAINSTVSHLNVVTQQHRVSGAAECREQWANNCLQQQPLKVWKCVHASTLPLFGAG